MSKADLLELIAITIAKYELANKHLHIQHFGKDEYCAWCVYSKKRSSNLQGSYHGAPRCTACPMLIIETPHFTRTCVDMQTYGHINPMIKETWQPRLALWLEVQRRIMRIDDPGFYSDKRNITNLILEVEEQIVKDFKSINKPD